MELLDTIRLDFQNPDVEVSYYEPRREDPAALTGLRQQLPEFKITWLPDKDLIEVSRKQMKRRTLIELVLEYFHNHPKAYDLEIADANAEDLPTLEAALGDRFRFNYIPETDTILVTRKEKPDRLYKLLVQAKDAEGVWKATPEEVKFAAEHLPFYNFLLRPNETVHVTLPQEETDLFVDDPDAPRVTNEKGGMQSKLDVDYRFVDPVALVELCKVMMSNSDQYGGKYPINNWQKIPAVDHYNHLMHHLVSMMATPDQEADHAAHALCRAMMLVNRIAAGESVHDERQHKTND